MTIREMQFAIQAAIDDDANGITDDATLVARPTENGTIEFYAVTPPPEIPNGKPIRWHKLG